MTIVASQISFTSNVSHISLLLFDVARDLGVCLDMKHIVCLPFKFFQARVIDIYPGTTNAANNAVGKLEQVQTARPRDRGRLVWHIELVWSLWSSTFMLARAVIYQLTRTSQTNITTNTTISENL